MEVQDLELTRRPINVLIPEAPAKPQVLCLQIPEHPEEIPKRTETNSRTRGTLVVRIGFWCPLY